ncbi:MAG: helix-turn-helix transcriptional regulator [Cyclobacteriaceae bacterium]|nr:helix-turn-helix transcriptional regulator [Cyclobacteriaceae bacterium HetDA_MAG_MS6]
MESIGQRVKYLREKYSLSQLELVAQIEGYDRFQIGKLERDEFKRIPSDLVTQLVSVFNTSHEWLERGEGPVFKDDHVSLELQEPQMPYSKGENLIDKIDQLKDNPFDEALYNEVKTGAFDLMAQLTNSQYKVIDLMEKLEKLKKMISEKLNVKIE